MKRRIALILYVLSAYVVIQFIWWGYHLIELTNELSEESSAINKRVAMILGEGAVFLLILFVGIWQIRKSILKDLKLSAQQNNFLLSVTHELKTPLAASKLYIQTVKKRELSREQSNEILAKAIEENDRLERMIDNILNAARLENHVMKLSKDSFDLSQLSESIIERFKHFKNAKRLTSKIDKDTTINADRLLIETILSNLIENALKYAGADTKIVVYATHNSEEIRFGVKDEGPGVHKADQPEIFKKFYRSGNEDTRTQKGSGLGLYIVSQLVHLHQGTIRYTDNTPKGANFEIKLKHG
ncbi:MAG: ATP-binding protein [Crocinitomicaceae bacterium]|nr:ATP-binding protein [Crocinitomicaceae bacterium]